MDRKKTAKKIDDLLDEANVLAVKLIEAEARHILKNHKDLDEFVMGMGTAFFTRKGRSPGWGHGTVQFDERKYMELIDQLITDYDDYFKITGLPMRFTANGEKITEW